MFHTDYSTRSEGRGLIRVFAHRSKTEPASGQIERALADGVAGRYVTAGELYGGAPW